MNKGIKQASNEHHKRTAEENITLSFDFIDWDSEHFFIHGLQKSYYKKLFDCFSEIKRSVGSDISMQTHPSLTPKHINFSDKKSTIFQNSFPDSVKQRLINSLKKQYSNDSDAEKAAEDTVRRAFELRIGKNYGRIHGFLFSNKFYIVWFDPAHNLFPGRDPHTGQTRKTKRDSEFAQVKTFCVKEINKMKAELIRLQEENESLIDMLDGVTDPAV